PLPPTDMREGYHGEYHFEHWLSGTRNARHVVRPRAICRLTRPSSNLVARRARNPPHAGLLGTLPMSDRGCKGGQRRLDHRASGPNHRSLSGRLSTTRFYSRIGRRYGDGVFYLSTSILCKCQTPF